jgi:hypothetical protein
LLTSEQPAKPAVTNPPATSSFTSEQEGTEDAQHPSAVAETSADVLALCRLITRILMRILHEHNDQVLQKLFLDAYPRQSQRRNTL